jgi:excisionase family DNA binding protein
MRRPCPFGRRVAVPWRFFVSKNETAADIRTLSIPEAAAASGLSVRTLRHLVSTRRIPVVKVGRLVRLRPADIEAYLTANTRPALSER